jgi:cell division protein FtsB
VLLISLLLIFGSPHFGWTTLLGLWLLYDCTEPFWKVQSGDDPAWSARLARVWFIQRHPLRHLAHQWTRIQTTWQTSTALKHEARALRAQIAQLHSESAAIHVQTAQIERETAALNASTATLERRNAVMAAVNATLHAGVASDLMVIHAAETTGESLEFCFSVQDELHQGLDLGPQPPEAI